MSVSSGEVLARWEKGMFGVEGWRGGCTYAADEELDEFVWFG